MNIGLIAAGGSSRRINGNNGGLPKQFVEVNEKPIIVYTIELLQNEPSIDHILIGARPEYFEYLKHLKSKFELSKIEWIVESGEKRHDTVYNALKFLQDKCADDDIIISLAAVAPIISAETIRKTIAAAREKGAAVAAMPLRNTLLIEGEDGEITEVPDRRVIRAITEPHAYRYGIVRKAYDKAYETETIDDSVTDDVQILRNAGCYQKVIEGNTDFVKITYQNDIKFFEQYLKEAAGK